MDKIILTSGKLKASVLPHGHPAYARMRFDWTGIVDELVFDGKHTFADAESPNPNHPSSGGLGFCNEFQCPEAVDAAGVGAEFAKFGVGALTRPDDKPYSFMRDVSLRPFECDTVVTGNSVSFALEPMNVAGYAASMRKTIRLEDAAMVSSYVMRNMGEKTINFREYNHNFLAINKRAIDKHYKLRINFVEQAELDRAKPALVAFEGGLGIIESDKTYMMHVINEGILDKPTYMWELTHDEEPAGLRETMTWKPAGISVWGISHVISPEVFFAASLAPGEEIAWERRWEFFYK